MINRIELKTKAKEVMHTCYWRSVGVSIILSFVAYGYAASGGSEDTSELTAAIGSAPQSEGIIAIATGIIASLLVFSSVIKIFAYNPIEIGCRKFFINSSYEQTSFSIVISPFKKSYFNQVLVMLISQLFILLWSLLFIIPGVIKSYSYRMVPYILAENPETDWRTAINRSRTMMNGYKWQAFIFDISFIGWYILTAITFGLVGLFYFNPYKSHADTQLYLSLKNNAPAVE